MGVKRRRMEGMQDGPLRDEQLRQMERNGKEEDELSLFARLPWIIKLGTYGAELGQQQRVRVCRK